MKYYVDKSKMKKTFFIWIDKSGNFRGIYEECLDAQDDKDSSGDGGYIISSSVIKERPREKTYLDNF